MAHKLSDIKFYNPVFFSKDSRRIIGRERYKINRDLLIVYGYVVLSDGIERRKTVWYYIDECDGLHHVQSSTEGIPDTGIPSVYLEENGETVRYAVHLESGSLLGKLPLYDGDIKKEEEYEKA
jgi:hypothetical protein